MKHEEKKKKL